MKAFVAPSAGATTIELADVPVPRIDEDELLVRVRAVGVGIHDSYFLPPGARFPFVVGIEAAGVVEEVGTQVSDHGIGDRIAFVSAMQLKGGTWAEYVAIRASALIVPIPDGMDFVRAASVPVAGNTALRAMRALPGGDRRGSLFVAGGSGAVGTFAIQIAAAAGWRVAASASAANHDYLLGLGADLAVDYRDPHWPDRVRQWAPGGADAAIAIQPDTTAGSMAVVRDGGTVVTVSNDQVPAERGIHVGRVPHGVDTLAEMTQLLVDATTGRVRLEIEHVYPFADAKAALAKVQTRHARGTLVLRMP